MAGIQIFIQAEGVRDIRMLDVPRNASVRDVVTAAAAQGFLAAADGKAAVFAEDVDEALPLDATLEAAGIGHRGSVHVHRCRKVAVSVHFNGTKSRTFAPGTTVHRVKEWAVSKQGFNLSPVDAAEHVLQVTGTNDRPDEDVHIGTLVSVPNCALELDLVAKVRVEG
jgi:hypothetical protein